MRIGSVDINNVSKVWQDGLTDAAQRQNQRLIFSRIDFMLSYLASDPKADADQINNLITVYWIENELIKEFGGNDLLLYRAGVILSNYCNDLINYSGYQRDANAQNVLQDIKRKTINGSEAPGDLRFLQEWETDVVAQNYYIDFATGSASPVYESAVITGTEPELADEFKKVAGNLVYTAVPYNLIDTQKAKQKYSSQGAVISEMCAAGFGYTQAICNNYINSSIMDASGWNPTEYVKQMKLAGAEGQQIGVGDGGLTAAILGLVSAFIAAGTTIFTTIYSARHKSNTESATSALYNARSSYAEIPDWLRIGDVDGDGTDDTLKIYGAGVAALAVLYFATKKKK